MFLILGLLLQKIRPRLPVAFLACFLLFSGLDLIGWMLFGKGSSLLVHKEWWSGPDYAYEGNGTLFLWVPQHAIVGMLGILFLLPDGEELPPQETIGLFGVATALWSPFVTLGLLPFVLSALSWRATLFDWSNLLCAMILGIPVLAYLLAGIGGIPIEAAIAHRHL